MSTRMALAAALMLAVSPLNAAEVCTPERRKELQVELDGIEALRKMGIGGLSLNAMRGACTMLRSVEGPFVWLAEPAMRRALALLKSQGYDLGEIDLHVFSSICKNIHYYVDDFAVGQRERQVLEELKQCPV